MTQVKRAKGNLARSALRGASKPEERPPLKVLLCVPAYGSTVRVETMRTVSEGMIHMVGALPGLTLTMMLIDLSEIGRVRNIFMTELMDGSHDAAIMIDADMSFPPSVFSILLNSEHEVCGLTYPKREMDFARFHASAQAGLDLDDALLSALNFVAQDKVMPQDGRIAVTRGFVEMTALPAGCLLIRRSAIERMVRENPSLIRSASRDGAEVRMGHSRVIGCFDLVTENGVTLSEDFSFCHRWRAIGGKVMGLVDVKVAHHGSMTYAGNYLQSLRLRARNGSESN